MRRRAGQGSGASVGGSVMQEVATPVTPSATPSPADRVVVETAAPELSIVMPVYNEADGVADVVAEVTTLVLDRLETSELVLVDDASTDATPQILDRLAEGDPRGGGGPAGKNGGGGAP